MTAGEDKKSSLQLLEWVYAVAAIMHMIGATGPLFYKYGGSGRLRLDPSLVTDGNLGAQLLGAGIYLIAAILLLPRLNDIITLLSRNKALLLFLGLILISAMWSELPGVTLRRSLALTGTTIFAMYLALRFKPSELMIMLGLAFGVTAVENIVMVIAAPNVAIHSDIHAGAWSGALGHKNIMGRTMVLGVLVLWVLATQIRTHKILVWSALFLCAFDVVMSQSRTSWVAGTALLLAIPFLQYLRRSHIPMAARVLLVAGMGLGGAAFLILQYADVGLDLIGRDNTLAGRTDIWEAAFVVGLDKPVLGHGYRTFWTLGLTNRLRIGNGHNSFLDLWLELGMVGLGFFMASLVVVGRRALRRLTTSSDRLGIWYPLFLMFMVLYGMAAQVFPDHATIAWVLYVVVSLYLTPFVAVTSSSHVPASVRPAAPAVKPLPAE